jgi:hypothetical protein
MDPVVICCCRHCHQDPYIGFHEKHLRFMLPQGKTVLDVIKCIRNINENTEGVPLFIDPDQNAEDLCFERNNFNLRMVVDPLRQNYIDLRLEGQLCEVHISGIIRSLETKLRDASLFFRN